MKFPVKCPSNDTIKSCLISFYKANRRHLCHDLPTVKTRNVSCDHTFKCAANIGKEEELKWMKLFDSTFIVISEGLVKYYKLTQGTGFEQVRVTLQNIAKDCRDTDNITLTIAMLSISIQSIETPILFRFYDRIWFNSATRP